ncbi:type II toxin-antitoxin system VapC family toxin [soil metagenome]
MIIDSSALVAIIKGEPDAEIYNRALLDAPSVRISAATLLEACIVADGYGSAIVSARLDDLLREVGAVVEPVTEAQTHIARSAHRGFGRGSGHPARLNFGDCFSYALAKQTGAPLLYKGDDFAHTDIRSALD